MTEDQRLLIMKNIEEVFLKHNRKLRCSETPINSKDIVFILEMVSAVLRGRVGITN